MTLKNILLMFVFLLSFSKLFSQDNINFVTYDIDNFWTAYDKITATKDSVQQYDFINRLFINKGSPGLKAIMQLGRYTDKSYINAINNYPLFWNSIRENTFKAHGIAKDIENDVLKVKTLYPDLKPAKIYFTIGALNRSGTTMDSMVLIGSEIALGDKTTITTDLPKAYAHLRPYYDRNSLNVLVFLNVHEYVHTQQKTTIGNNLLAQCVLEGIAEFVTIKATEKESPMPCLKYGKKKL